MSEKKKFWKTWFGVWWYMISHGEILAAFLYPFATVFYYFVDKSEQKMVAKAKAKEKEKNESK